MRKIPAILVAICLAVIFSAAATAALPDKDSEGWTLLNKDVYINRRSMAYSDEGTVSLWVKVVPDEDSDVLKQAREQLMNKGRDDKALAYLYSGILAEIDCSRNSHRQLITILYDANKNIIHSVDHHQASWTAISPESSFHLVREAVCEESPPVASQEYEGVRSGC